MKLLSIAFHGLTCYDEPASVDLEAAGRGLIAFVGRNGSGKTTALEVPYVSLYRSFATRAGSLYDHCHGQGYAQSTWRDERGRIVTARVTFDAYKRTMEGHVIVDGAPVTDGKLASFDATVRELFGSSELFLAGPFTAQTKAGGLLGMKKSERKALFAELLGLSRIEALHGLAHAERGGCQAALDHVRARLDDLGGLDGRICNTRAELSDCANEADEAKAEVALCEKAEELVAARVEASRGWEAARADLQACRIRDDEAKAGLQAALQKPKQIHQRAEELRKGIQARIDSDPVSVARKRYEDATRAHARRVEQIAERIAAAPDPAAARAVLDDVLARRAAHEKAVRDADAVDRQAQELRHALEGSRRTEVLLGRQAGEVDNAPCATKAPALVSECPLLAGAVDASERLRGVAEDIALTEAKIGELVKLRKSIEIPDPPAPGEEQAARDKVAVGATTDQLTRDLEVAKGDRSHEDLEGDILRAEAAVQADQEQIQRIADREQADLLDAEGEIQEARTRRDRAAEELQAAVEREAAFDGAAVEAVEREAAEAKAATRKARQSLDTLRERAARLDERLRQLRDDAQVAEALRAKAHDASGQVSDWTLLVEALGRDGVQALLIDVAGPEVSAIANELLAIAFGGRFSVEIRTLRTKRDGAQAEAFDIIVYDGVDERPFESYSPGEQVLIGESISLALAIYNARSNDVRWRTIFRDETSGALDSTTGATYPLMLRRALELGGFDQLLFISHDDYVVDAADACFEVVSGRIADPVAAAA